MHNVRNIRNIKRVIIKIGSSSLVGQDSLINEKMFHDLIEITHTLNAKNIDVVLVSSGAIAFGVKKLGLPKKPKELSLKQACAAVGQASLMATYQSYADKYNIACAQILVSHDDFENRKRMLHLTETFAALFKAHILPIVNENDTLTSEEIKIGDNDTLAGMLCPMVDSDLLILLSDIDGLYTANPRINKEAELIPYVEKVNKKIEAMAGDAGSSVGTGGMHTKLKAAYIASQAGSAMVIMNSQDALKIINLIEGENIGTWFAPNPKGVNAKNHWLIYRTHVKGEIMVDDGAKQAIMAHNSLLPKGILNVKGEFLEKSIVYIIDTEGEIIAKGITPYTSAEINLIKGLTTQEAQKTINRKIKAEVVHANDMVILSGGQYGYFD